MDEKIDSRYESGTLTVLNYVNYKCLKIKLKLGKIKHYSIPPLIVLSTHGTHKKVNRVCFINLKHSEFGVFGSISESVVIIVDHSQKPTRFYNPEKRMNNSSTCTVLCVFVM